MSMVRRGWGAAAGKNKPDKIVDRYCLSPQLAPPMVNAREKAAFAASENYHEGKKK